MFVRMVLGFMPGMIVLMRAVLTGVIMVVRLRCARVIVLVRVFMRVFVGMFMTVYVGVRRVSVGVYMFVLMRMHVGMFMLVIVFAFHVVLLSGEHFNRARTRYSGSIQKLSNHTVL